MVLALGACTTTTTSSSESSGKPSSPSSNSESGFEYSDDPFIEHTDDSIPFSTEVNNGLEYSTLGKILGKFSKEEYGYYGGSFNKKLDEPSTTVTTHQELVDLFDYCAFYKIKEKDVTINIEGDAIAQCNLAAWDSSMIPGTVGTLFKENEDGTINVKFKYVDNANSFVPGDLLNGIYMSYFPYIYDYNDENKAKITSIPYVGEKELDVHNSDQLIYALTHGYKPVMQNGSPAKKIYDYACTILKDIIYKDMNDNEKLLAIEFYLANTTEYDYKSDDTAAFASPYHTVNCEEISCLLRGFYAEGALFNGGAVCYGYAKAQALLSSLLGFQVKLTHGSTITKSSTTNDPLTFNQLTGNIYNAHGINLVRKDDNSKWGICDPTFRSAGTLAGIGEDEVQFKRHPAVMLSYDFWKETYTTADEAAFRFINSEDLLEVSYDFTEDYHLIGGYSLAPRTPEDAANTFKGIFDTVKKLSGNNSGKRYYIFSLYPVTSDDEEAIPLIDMYNEAYYNSELYNTAETVRYVWRKFEYLNSYGYSVYVKY